MADPITYEQWLLLNDEERWTIRKAWNSYAGENLHIPREAGRRLTKASALPIVRVRVGTYHMGEYILNPELWPKDFDKAPPWFEQEFEGFRVGYCKHDPTIKWPDDD